MKLIIEIDENSRERLFDIANDGLDVPMGLENIMIMAIANGIPIPDNATNGDVVKAIFSNTFDNFCERTTWEWNRWWNAPYQKGGK